MADEEDPFADLLGPYGLQQPEVKEEVQVMRPSPRAKDKETERDSSPATDHTEAKRGTFTEPSSMPANMFVLPKEETKEFIRGSVDASVEKAVQAAVGKLVGSMRDVLRVIVQRMESLEAKVGNLHNTVAKLDVESTQTNLHARFTSIDEGLRDIGRSVQAMRDRSELVDAQKELARLQLESEAHKKKDTGASDTGRAEGPASNASDTATQPSAPPPNHQQPPANSVAPPPQAAVPQQPAVPPAPAQVAPTPPPQALQPPPPPHPAGPPAPVAPGPAQYPQHDHSAASVPQHQHAQPSTPYAPPSSAPPPPPHYSTAPALPQTAPQQQVQPGYPGASPPAHYPDPSRQVPPTSTAQYPTFAVAPPPPSPSFGGYPHQPPPPAERGSRYMDVDPPRFNSSSGPGGLAMPRPPPPPTNQAAPREGMSTMSTQQIVSDLCSMGFERGRVERVLASVIQQGKGVDLNSVVDILMNSSQ